MKTAETLEVERKIVFAARQAESSVPRLVDDYENGNPNQIHQTWPEQVFGVQRNLDTFREQLQEHTDRHPDTGREIDDLRRETLLWIKQLHDALGIITHAFRQQTTGLDYEEGEQDLSDDDIKNVGKSVINCLEGFEQFAWQLELALGEEIPKVWSRVRELERAAVGYD